MLRHCPATVDAANAAGTLSFILGGGRAADDVSAMGSPHCGPWAAKLGIVFSCGLIVSGVAQAQRELAAEQEAELDELRAAGVAGVAGGVAAGVSMGELLAAQRAAAARELEVRSYSPPKRHDMVRIATMPATNLK